jgi:hypothetical protein
VVERPSVISNMAEALQQRLFPTVIMWNRLESRPRADNFDRALSAEIRDPLWMLTRQWQLGEFEGADAGSPIAAKIRMDTTRLTGYQPAGQPARALREDVPLEGLVEQRPMPLQAGGRPMSFDLRLLMGRQWLKMLAKHVGDFAGEYRGQYPIAVPDPTGRDSAALAAHPEAWQRVEAVATRMMDGYAFYEHVKSGGDATDGVAVPPGKQGAVRDQATRFVAWFDELFLQPGAPDDAWLPPRLEYAFSASAPSDAGPRGFVADEYYQGRLDWYSVDADPAPAPPAVAGPDPQEHTLLSFVPTPVAYRGMPNTRWWAFEEGKTNFGAVTPSTTDLGKLLFIEFGLVYANDWFLLPHAIPAGSIADVEGLVVTNGFGERIWVEAAGGASDGPRQPWAMFRVSRAGDDTVPGDTSLLMLPTVPKIQEGQPIEDVALIRDEIANMVWAVESTVPLPTGESKAGREAALETAALHARIVAGQPPGTQAAIERPPPKAPISYRTMTAVDENWIPFVPVHIEGESREIQLQRASMPRIIDGDVNLPAKIEPRTGLLREGLEAQPKRSYYVHEQEVSSRAGARVYRSYRRARWSGGRAVIWLGTRKQTGRSSRSSGLAFDSLENTPPQSLE